ncbi:hypothetical protein KVR01_005110 [Diaporthe batatas]|uniref:uncharacterized protein n=1 Tax=Diaporthe batatas TaxID=748121 RepID=UPI001D03C54B|nr:uncharacterized protein KVR01_005110 [Diaporthe batatas]KAG8164835.1 hypothetical protein KVR01_005110 [Diaporthe batatas]
MKFTAGFIAVVTAAAPALAIQLTNTAYAVEAGQPFTLTWSDSEGPVTITLKNGASSDLKDVQVIASGITTDSFTWTPPSSLPSDLYAFEVTDSSAQSPNYSPQFPFQGNGAATTAESSSASSSASASTTLSSLTITSTASATTSSANSSATISSSASSNGTTTASSTSSTRTSTRTSATSESTSESTPVNTNGSQKLGSPLALILGTVVSLMIFN